MKTYLSNRFVAVTISIFLLGLFTFFYQSDTASTQTNNLPAGPGISATKTAMLEDTTASTGDEKATSASALFPIVSAAPVSVSPNFLAVVEQLGTNSGKIDLFNLTLGGSGGADTFSAASPAQLAVTNSTNETKPDVDNPRDIIFDGVGDLLIANGGQGGALVNGVADYGSFACVPAGAIATGSTSTTTNSSNARDPESIAIGTDSSVAIGNVPASAAYNIVEYLLGAIYTPAPTTRDIANPGANTVGATSVISLPTLTAGTFAAAITNGTNISRVTIKSPSGTETPITDTDISSPEALGWDAQNNQMAIGTHNITTVSGINHNSSKLVLYNVSPVSKVKSVQLGTDPTTSTDSYMFGDKLAVSPDGHVAVAGGTADGPAEVRVYNNTAARDPVGGPIPFDSYTNNACSVGNFGNVTVVRGMRWLSNTKLLVALQANGAGKQGVYIYDISTLVTTPGLYQYDGNGGNCNAVTLSSPKQTGFQAFTNPPLSAIVRPFSVAYVGVSSSNCNNNAPCFTSINSAISGTTAGGIINVLGGTFNESVNLNNNVIVNLDADTTVNDFTISTGTLNAAGGNCAQANGANLTLASGNFTTSGGTFNAGSSTVTLASGNWLNNGGTFNQGTGKVVFSGSSAQTIGGTNATTFNDVIVNNTSGGGVSLGNNETIGSALTLTNGALGVGTNTLTLNGAASRTSGSLTSAATGTINYNQSSDGQAVLAANYGNLTFSNFKKTLPNGGGTVGIAGTFSPGTATGHTVTGSTVEFNGTSAQTLPSGFTIYNNLTLNNPAGTTGFAGLTVNGLMEVKAGTFTGNNTTAKDVQIDNAATLAGTNATIINVAGNWANNGTFTSNGNTVNFNGSAIQSIGGTNATTFNNLTLNNAAGGASLGNSQTIGGTLTLTNGTLGIGSNTLTLNGAVAFSGGVFNSNSNGTVNYNQSSNGQAVAPGQYGNLTFSNFSKTLPNGSSVKIAGLFTTGSGGGHTITGSTIEFNGTASAQTLPSGFTTYNNLTLNNTAGTTGFAGLVVQNLLRTQAGTFTTGGTFKDVQIDAGTTLASNSAATINVSGAWTNNGTFTASGTGTVNFNGLVAQTIGGSTATSFNNLTLANTAGISLGANISASGTLLINPSVLFNLSSFDVTAVGTLTNNGTIRKTQAVTGTGAKTFGLAGRFNGANLTVDVTTKGTLSSLQVDRIDANHPNAAAPEQTNRYWIITPTGTGYSVNLTLPRDNANAPSACRYTGTGTVWDCDVASSTANSVTRNNVTTLSAPWAVGDNAITAPSIAEAFSPTTINYGGTSTVTLTLSNSNINSLVGASFTDTLANMSAVGGAVGGTCTGTTPNSLAAGATNLSFSGITIPANGNCTITFAVTSTNVGVNPNTTSGVTTTQTPTAGTQGNTANLTVNPPADLTVLKTHTGNFTQGDTAKTYTMTVTNSGGSPTSGTVTLVDALPSGLTATAISGTGWNCTLGTLTCTRNDALAAAAGSYPAITLTVNVANNAASSVTNSVTVSGGGETNTSNDTATDPTTVNPAPTYSISGQVTNGGAALEGVSVALSGDTTASIVTDASGNYTFSNLTSTSNHTVTPTLNGYTFSPANTPVNNITGNQTNVNFATSVASYEADAAPRPTGDGDGTVNGGDVTMIRRFVAGIETPASPANGSEFQRVDCAPLYDANNVLVKGDGAINGGDITQVRRFAAGLDAVVPAGGPASAAAVPPSGNSLTNENSALLDSLTFAGNLTTNTTVDAPIAVTRDVHPVKVSQTGNVLTVAVNLNTDAAATAANTVDFTLQYDTAVLSNPTNIRLGSNAPNVTNITPNTLQSGKVGIVLDLPVAGAVTTFPIGSDAQLVLIDFTVASNPPATTNFSFGNVPVSDFVGGITGNNLPSTFTAAPVSILGPTAATVSVSGRVLTQTGRGISGVQLSLTDSQGNVRTATTTSFGYYNFNGIQTGETYVLSANAKHYTFSQPVQVLNISQQTDQVDFIANSEKKTRSF